MNPLNLHCRIDNIRHPRQQGLTLVELMIAMVIGLILIAGVIQIFLSSQQAYRTQESMSRIQESGRFALEILARDIRQSGFKGGCGQDVNVNILLNQNHPDYDATLLDLNDGGLRGWDNNAGPYKERMKGYKEDTDVLLVKHAATHSNVTASGNTPAQAATVNLSSASGIPYGAIVVIADAEACDIFQNASNANENRLTRGYTGDKSPGNKLPASDNPFSKNYGKDMNIMTLSSHIYYVGASDANPNRSALRRLSFPLGTGTNDAIDDEIVEGVIDMQIRYGIDNTGNAQVDVYDTANNVGDWNRVVAVRVNLLIRGEDHNVMPEPMTLAFDGNEFRASEGDLRMYQVFSTTVGIRNRLP